MIKTRHFQSEIHTLRSQATQNTPAFAFGNTTSLHGVEVIVNEKTYIKLRVNPTNISSQNLEHHINKLLNKNYFPRYKYQLSYLSKFSKCINRQSFAEEIVFLKWVKSDFNYNHTNPDHTIHN